MCSMSIEDRKASVLNCIGLGLSYAQAEVLAECSAEEREQLAADEMFQARVAYKAESLKRRLLESIIGACEMNVAVGTTTEARWLLEKLDKERFGNGKSAGDALSEGSSVQVYLPDNGRDR